MVKTYRFNKKQFYARIVVITQQGASIIYEFTHGNPMTNILPKCVVRGEWEQNELEKSDYVKRGLVAIDSVFDDSSETEAVSEGNTKELKNVTDVKSVTQAINYVSENFGVVTHSAIQAKMEAEKHGVAFPNLKTGKKA